MFVNEAGPGNMFRSVREWAGIGHDDDGNKTIIPDGFFAGVLSCVWCASLWAAMFWVGMDWIFSEITIRVAMVFALSALAVVYQKWVG